MEYLGRIKYDFQKSRVTDPWNHKVLVSAKNLKKCHACVPLREDCKRGFIKKEKSKDSG
jgi:hypothetical protein